MKGLLKRYAPPLFTLLLIAAGAAMPWLTSAVQDARIGTMQEDFDLNTVNLTFRQGGEASIALRLLSEEHTDIPWAGKTSMTGEEACEAAMEAVREMDRYGLLPEGGVEYLSDSGRWAEPSLLLGEDGTSALVWNCYWAGDFSCYLMIDDTTGKTVHFLVETGMNLRRDPVRAMYQRWSGFLTGYYGIEIVSAARALRGYSEEAPDYLLLLTADLKDGLEPCELELELVNSIAIFNINMSSKGDALISIDTNSMQVR